MAVLLLVALLWLPGALLRRAWPLAPGPWGCGRFAVEASLSLGLLSVVLLPLYVAEAPLSLAPPGLLMLLTGLAIVAFVRRDASPGATAFAVCDGADAKEIVAFAIAALLLLPVTLAHSGANVDDWWDLSFVSGWIADGRFGFAQMALTTDPANHVSSVHPRFLWSVWLVLQSVVAWTSGEAPWKVQAGPLAGVCIVLVASAQAALARALGRLAPASRPAIAVTLAMTVAWIWGSEALPLFVRGYQDKLFAGLVLAPVLVAFVLDALQPDDEDVRPHAAAVTVALGAIAIVSVHSLLFTMAAFTAVLAIVAVRGREAVVWLRSHVAVVASLLLPALYPLGQAVALAFTFGEQGVSLATPDNPVVRAHLALGRLVGTSTPAWVVHPGAVFGSVALLALAGLAIAWRRRRSDAAARVLVAITIVPSMLLFVPGLAALAGRLWVPWMLYRLGWMVPVAALLAYAWQALARASRRRGARVLAPVVFAMLVAWLAGSTAADRLRRGLGEHPGQPSGAPIAAAAAAYDFLAACPGRDAVLAPANFSELLPALSGKPVVAFPERGSLVFSADETLAYERMRDRALFFSSASTPPERDEIAARYGVRWAVLPRTLVASGSEANWLWRFGADALLAAEAVDSDAAEPCANGVCRGWWSRTRDGVESRLPPSWKVVFESRDFFVVERDAGAAPAGSPSSRSLATSGRDAARWLRPFVLDADRAPMPAGDVLATVTDTPGSRVGYAMPPRYLAAPVLPIWTEGPAPWEDAPAEAVVTMDIGVACRVAAVAVLPHLPRDKRDVFEVQIDDRTVRSAARHNVAIVVPLAAGPARSRVDVRVRSLLGNPVSLADIRIVGDHDSCEGKWPVFPKARAADARADADDLLRVAARFPASGRPFVAMAGLVAAIRGKGPVVTLLREATSRDPSLVEGWIALGFAEEMTASINTDADATGRAHARARLAFEAGIDADSHSAWARGCAAWSERGSGHPLFAIWNALEAAELDPGYGDAWTVLAYALGDIHLRSLAEKSLAMAESVDPARNWPALARADLAMKNGDRGAALAALQAWLDGHPFDDGVRAKLEEIDAQPPAAATGTARP